MSNPKDTVSPYGWENFSCWAESVFEIMEIKLILYMYLVGSDDPIVTYHDMTLIDGTLYEGNFSVNMTLTNASTYYFYIWVRNVHGDSNSEIGGFFDLPSNWDIDMNGQTHFMDLIAVSSKYNQVGPPGWIREDINNDDTVHFMDLILVSAHYNEYWK